MLQTSVSFPSSNAFKNCTFWCLCPSPWCVLVCLSASPIHQPAVVAYTAKLKLQQSSEGSASPAHEAITGGPLAELYKLLICAGGPLGLNSRQLHPKQSMAQQPSPNPCHQEVMGQHKYAIQAWYSHHMSALKHSQFLALLLIRVKLHCANHYIDVLLSLRTLSPLQRFLCWMLGERWSRPKGCSGIHFGIIWYLSALKAPGLKTQKVMRAHSSACCGWTQGRHCQEASQSQFYQYWKCFLFLSWETATHHLRSAYGKQ